MEGGSPSPLEKDDEKASDNFRDWQLDVASVRLQHN
jgi:hypothetical protein